MVVNSFKPSGLYRLFAYLLGLTKFKSVDLTGNKTSDSDFNGQTPVDATTDAEIPPGAAGVRSATGYLYYSLSKSIL